MASHWKHAATRCAMPDCERTRRKGWTTCALLAHAERGVSLYGLRPGMAKLLPPDTYEPEAPTVDHRGMAVALRREARDARIAAEKSHTMRDKQEFNAHAVTCERHARREDEIADSLSKEDTDG